MFGWYRVELYYNGSFHHTLLFKFKTDAIRFAETQNCFAGVRALLSF